MKAINVEPFFYVVLSIYLHSSSQQFIALNQYLSACRHRFDVWVADRVVFLAAAKQGAAKQRVCFEFLGTIRQEYDVKGYADQQNVSSFKKFVEAQLVRPRSPQDHS